MPPYIYIVIQSDFASLDDEEILKADVEIISCHATLDAANEAAKDWVIEACGGDDDDEQGYDDYHDNAHDLAHECFDTTFYLPPYDDRYSIRIQVVKKRLRGPLPPASASSSSDTASRPSPERSNLYDKANIHYHCPYGAMAMVPVGAKPNGLRNARVSLVGQLDGMRYGNAIRAIEILGGSVPYSLTNADYIVMGTIGKEVDQFELNELKLPGLGEKIDEKGFSELVTNGIPIDKVLKEFDADVDSAARLAMYGSPFWSVVEEVDDDLESSTEGEEKNEVVAAGPPTKRQRI